jgi:hypothetical protein
MAAAPTMPLYRSMSRRLMTKPDPFELGDIASPDRVVIDGVSVYRST